MNDHIHHPENPTKGELLIDFVKTRLLTILAIACLAGAVAIYTGFDIELPRFWKIVGAATLFLLPYSYIVGAKVVSLLHNPNYIFVVDLDARHLEGALYQFPYTDFRELEAREGSFTQLTPNLYTAKDVDLEAMEATGTWRGTLDDRELCRALQAVHECRGQLEDDAKRGFAIETSAFTIIRNAVRRTTLHVVETFESGSLPDEGSALHEAVEDQLEQFDLEDNLETLAEDVDVSPAEAEGEIDDLETSSETEPTPEPTEVAADD
ncbi:hypothetical protein ACERIT_03810 [Halopenitus sp. H-Gu1]|uniref:hypothetical protein n=1 Tax=Halopenitus sp. H-Gu1 TaxID=3242697 RepID=UPI00359E2AD0